MKRIKIIVAVILALSLLSIIVFRNNSSETFELTILHTNDVHAHLDTIAKQATVIEDIREEIENVLLLSAGDVFSGTLYYNIYGGMADLDFMNKLDYDAMCLGNHEFDNFDIDSENLVNFIAKADFPILCANFDFSDEPDLKNSVLPWTILEIGGERIGVFGLTTPETREISTPGKEITIHDHIEGSRTALKALKDEGIDRVIALTHLGWNVDLELAREVEGIDIIIGGHSHTLPDEYPTVVGNTLVVQAGEYGTHLGRLDVSFDRNGVITEWNGELIEMDDSIPEDVTYGAMLFEYSVQIEEVRKEVIGHTVVDLNGERVSVRTGETNLGNLITDSMLAKTRAVNATIAILNSGGIRASIPAGDVTLGEVLTVMPFGSTLVVFDLTGEEIVIALENGVSQVEDIAGRFPQVAGLNFVWNPEENPGDRIVEVMVNTPEGYQLIDPEKTYKIVTNNFIHAGGDGYSIFQKGKNFINMGFVDYDVLMEYIEENSPINYKNEGRSSPIT